MKNTRTFLRQLLSDKRCVLALKGLWLLMALVIAVATLTPQERALSLTENDKVDHILAFAALATVAVLFLRLHKPVLAAAFAVHVLFGAGIELGQMWVPGRDGSLADLLAGATGVVIGALLGASIRVLASQKPAERG